MFKSEFDILRRHILYPQKSDDHFGCLFNEDSYFSFLAPEEAERFLDASACRDWVYQMAATNRDPSLLRGDYECGVGKPKSKYGLNVYRITIK